MIGMIFGRLEVLNKCESEGGPTKWLCKCECGTEKVITQHSLKQGVKSCGCLKVETTIKNNKNRLPKVEGRVFGRLLVISKDEANDSRHKKYICQCSCGNIKSIAESSLLSGNTLSCGCYAIEVHRIRLPNKGRNINELYGKCKYSAGRRSIPFSLDKTEYMSLITKECYYCGDIAGNTHYASSTDETFKYNGLDRLDNSLGYEVGNVVPCCAKCNYGKYTQDELGFYTWIKRIYEYKQLDTFKCGNA